MTHLTHRCPVGDCLAAVRPEQPMCPQHWRLVPSPLKRALHRAWQGGAGAGSAEHQQALRACIDAAQASCEPSSDQNLRQMVRRFLAGYRHPNHINGESWDEEDGHPFDQGNALPPAQAQPTHTTLQAVRSRPWQLTHSPGMKAAVRPANARPDRRRTATYTRARRPPHVHGQPGPAATRGRTRPQEGGSPMRDIANATLSGNLTRDVEHRTLPSGTDVARLRVATTTRRKAGEEWIEKTNYFTIEVYGAQGRACAQYLAKGSRVVVDAELDWREWTDQQDNKREAVTFRARQVLFEGARPGAATAPREQNGATGQPDHPGHEPAGVATGADGTSASAEDLPF